MFVVSQHASTPDVFAVHLESHLQPPPKADLVSMRTASLHVGCIRARITADGPKHHQQPPPASTAAAQAGGWLVGSCPRGSQSHLTALCAVGQLGPPPTRGLGHEQMASPCLL